MIQLRRFSIGELRIQLKWPSERCQVILDSALDAFSAAADSDLADISFTVAEPRTIDFDSHRELFNTLPDGLWKVWKSADEKSYIFSLHEVLTDNSPYRIAVTDNTLRKIEVFSPDADRKSISPLEYPLDELIISGHLNINRIGILLHSALVSLNGRGLLFSGTSGSGKSTLSELWLAENKADVLTDERVIIREKEGSLWAFGTPWHGTAGIHKNKGAPLSAVCFIRHGAVNELRRLSVMDAANRLMVRCFPTFWHKEGMQFALDFCGLIASSIECYEFGFVPDESAVNFIMESLVK